MTAANALRFIVRKASEEDLPACLALDHSSTSDYVWQVETHEAQETISFHFRTVRLPRPTVVPYPQETETLRIAWHQSDCFLVAEAQGAIYGYLTMRGDRAHGIGWVYDLVVDRARRRHRVGTALLLQARQWAQDHQLRRIILETQTKNYPAIAFCQRQGLVFCGFNDQYYPNQDIALFFSQAIR